MTIGLIGGSNILKYTIADVLWGKISELSKIDFKFEIVAIENLAELKKFYDNFCEDADYVGFNVALPWKSEVIKLVDSVDKEAEAYGSMNVIYKREGKVFSSNTDTVGIERSVSSVTNIDGKKILILGLGGAGYPTSILFSQKYDCSVFAYDVKPTNRFAPQVVKLNNAEDIANQIYDIVINATPVGKGSLDETPLRSLSPLTPDVVHKITHKDSVIVEMNYFPFRTGLLKIGLLEGLAIVPGTYMLVYQALEAFRIYTGFEFKDAGIKTLLGYMKDYSVNKENELLQKNSLYS